MQEYRPLGVYHTILPYTSERAYLNRHVSRATCPSSLCFPALCVQLSFVFPLPVRMPLLPSAHAGPLCYCSVGSLADQGPQDAHTCNSSDPPTPGSTYRRACGFEWCAGGGAAVLRCTTWRWVPFVRGSVSHLGHQPLPGDRQTDDYMSIKVDKRTFRLLIFLHEQTVQEYSVHERMTLSTKHT